jgi:hypothetical protein
MRALKRCAAFGAALGLALGLHAAAAFGLAAVMGSPPDADLRASVRPAMELRWITVVPAAPAAAESPTPPAAGLPADTLAAAAATAPAAPAALSAARGPEFLGSDAVDEPARPASTWALDAEGLASLGITRIVFDTWVDANAQVAGLRVVAMEPASTASLAPLVEARLATTPMVAARKGGQPVAHQQRIDLGWQPAAGRPG